MDRRVSRPVAPPEPGQSVPTAVRETAATLPAWSAEAMLERLAGDDELARQLVALFLVEYPKLLATLHATIESAQGDAVRRAAHATKGCLANFVESGPHATAYEIERLAAEGRVDATPPLLARLEREIAAIVIDMRKFEAGASCES
jgi:two-component system, sensor histidine kinase and response regulator